MSRAFITDKEDWSYCAKAGERCLHAEPGTPCTRTDCEYFDREAQPVGSTSGGLRVVARRTEKAAAKANEPGGRPSAKTKKANGPGGRRPGKTKKASLPKPRKWGGRS